MKGILEFNLDDREDKMSFKRCNKSLNMAIVLFDIEANSKRIIEAKIDNQPSITSDEVLDIVFGVFNELLQQNDINIDELID